MAIGRSPRSTTSPSCRESTSINLWFVPTVTPSWLNPQRIPAIGAGIGPRDGAPNPRSTTTRSPKGPRSAPTTGSAAAARHRRGTCPARPHPWRRAVARPQRGDAGCPSASGCDRRGRVTTAFVASLPRRRRRGRPTPRGRLLRSPCWPDSGRVRRRGRPQVIARSLTKRKRHRCGRARVGDGDRFLQLPAQRRRQCRIHKSPSCLHVDRQGRCE